MKATKTFTALDWGKQFAVDFVGEMGLFSFDDKPMMALNRTSICCITGSKSLKNKSRVDKIIVKRQPYQWLNTSREFFLKDKFGIDKNIVEKQP